ncbi:unnamed protein product [Blepharisma stoltei]|uniref:Uncharacterized protein n=1 Tax=Blepharisma stoltei TaxID=1481888 RepID=A0AAU9J075_9CILI|nr:unnamed protein product [Blepharisma stoltei]
METMELPVILKDLKNESFLKEISIFQEDIDNFILDSVKKGLLKGVKIDGVSNPISSQNYYIKRINSLLPNANAKISFHKLLAMHANDFKCQINIPTTLLKLGKMDIQSYLIFTNGSGQVSVKKCNETEFFDLKKEKSNKAFPLCCLKHENEDITSIFSKDIAISEWKKASEKSIMQHFIDLKSNPTTIIRVLWRKNMKNKYFIIINKNKYPVQRQNTSSSQSHPFRGRSRSNTDITECDEKLLKIDNNFHIPSHSRNRSHSDASDFKTLKIKKRRLSYIPYPGIKLMNVQHSQSYFSPPKIKKDCKRADSNERISPKKEVLPHINVASNVIKEEENKKYFVITKDIESCYAIESYKKAPEIEAMINQIVAFLNSCFFTSHNQLKGIIADFIQDSENKWVLLDCKDYITEADLNINTTKMQKLEPTKRSRSTQNLLITAEANLTVNNIFKHDVIFRNSNLNKGISKKNTLRNEACKIDLIDLSHTKIADNEETNGSQVDTDETPSRKNTECTTSPHDNIQNNIILYGAQFFSPIFKQKNDSPPQCQSQSKSLWKDNNYTHIRKHYVNIVSNFDEMVTSVKVAKKKQENLVEKYGGTEFWNQFILSFYRKVLSTEMLKKHFKNTNLENFGKIVSGMFRILSGSVNLEFRRKIRAVHANMKIGITESEFDCFADIFVNTLNDFSVSEEDRNLIMIQVKSMKRLVAR